MTIRNASTTVVLTGAGPHELAYPIDVIGVVVPDGGTVTVAKDGTTFLTLFEGVNNVEFRSSKGITVSGSCTVLLRVAPHTTKVERVLLEAPEGNNYVRTTRFAEISSGTSGTVTLPPGATVILDDFGGTTDAVVVSMEGGRPTYQAAIDTLGNIVATSFNSSGNYTLTGTPLAYPVAIIYRVRQYIEDYDYDSSDIVGSPQLVFDQASRISFTPAGSISATTVQQAIEELDDEKLGQTFEVVSKNLASKPADFTYTLDKLTSIEYDLGGGDSITKTFNYTGDKLTSLVLSGDTPSGIQLTKTLGYTGDTLTSISYS